MDGDEARDLFLSTDGKTGTICTEEKGRASTCSMISVAEPELIAEMALYELFQGGLMVLALVAGLFVGLHLLYCRAEKCQNWGVLFTSHAIGFLQMLLCIYLLTESQALATYQFGYGMEDPTCVDYFPSATVANASIFLVLVLNLIHHNTSSSVKKFVFSSVLIMTILTGLVILFRDIAQFPSKLTQKPFATLSQNRSGSGSEIDVFWSVCIKDIHEEEFRLLVEYLFLYLPVACVVFITWTATSRKLKSWSPMDLRFLAKECNDDQLDSGTCVCTRMNTVIFAILCYSAVVLFIARPVMVVYGLYFSNGTFRDILPSLLNTVVYCFLCSEYLLSMFKLARKKNARPHWKCVYHV